MIIVIFDKKYENSVAYGVAEKDKVTGYLRMTFNLFRWEFTVETPNFTACYRNPITAIVQTLKHESTGRRRYEALKERLRTSGMWGQI